jgi:anti-sigma factor RsiW
MACPDELTLDLWLAGALPADEAAAVGSHVQTCATCAAARQTVDAFGAELHAALELTAEELAYASGLELASSWRTSRAADSAWGWIALASVIAGFAAWWMVAPLVGSLVAAALQVGAGTVLLNAAFGLALNVGQALLGLTRNPALWLTQPLLALLALALLAWPRHVISQRSTYA